MSSTLLKKYKLALKVAEKEDKLRYHLPRIKSTIRRLSDIFYTHTTEEEVWVYRFLSWYNNNTLINNPDELRDWYFTCTENFSEFARKGILRIDDNCYLEVYPTLKRAAEQANPYDIDLIRIRIPNRLVGYFDTYYESAGIKGDVVNSLQYYDGILTCKTIGCPKVSDNILDKYDRIIEFTYAKYLEQKDDIKYGFISGDRIKWLIDRLYLKDATDEQLNEYWFAIDRFFRSFIMEKDVKGEWKWKTDVDIRWYMDCDSAWKEVINHVARSRRGE